LFQPKVRAFGTLVPSPLPRLSRISSRQKNAQQRRTHPMNHPFTGLQYASVCSGIEAVSVAWQPLGITPVWFAEIEPFPCAVLAHHYPEVPNLGDMALLAEKVLSEHIPAPPILIGGTPCQAFSIAGLRAGLADPRGVLSLKYVELANAIDQIRCSRNEPESIIVWENVPGVLSDKGNAFGCFLAALAGEEKVLEPPRKTWSHAGVVLGPKDNRVANPGCPIFRRGPTTPSCVPCRKCSTRV